MTPLLCDVNESSIKMTLMRQNTFQTSIGNTKESLQNEIMIIICSYNPPDESTRSPVIVTNRYEHHSL